MAKLTKNGFTFLIKEFEPLIEKGHSVTLFLTLFDELLFQTTDKILDYVGSLGNLFQKSGESANNFKIWYTRVWERMAYLGYNNLIDI